MYTHLSYDETELLSLSSQGEEQAFIRLLQMHKHKLYSFLHTITGFELQTESLFQQLVQQLWQKREDLMKVEEFDYYLFENLSPLLLPGLRKPHPRSTDADKAAIEQLVAKCFQDDCTSEEKTTLNQYLHTAGHAQAMQEALLPVWNTYTAATFIPEALWQKAIAQIPDEENPLARKATRGKSGLFGLFGRR